MAVGWRTCPQCGKNNEPGKRYCVECGTRLVEPQVGPTPVTGHTPPTAKALQEAWEAARVRRNLRGAAVWNVFIGVLTLAMGITHMEKSGLNLILALIGLVLIGTGVALRYAPAPATSLANALAMLLPAFWNTMILVVVMVGSTRIRTEGGLLFLLPAIFAAMHLRLHGRFMRTRHVPKDLIAEAEAQLKRIQQAKPAEDVDLITFRARGKDWKAQVSAGMVTLVGGKAREVRFVPADAFALAAQEEIQPGGKGRVSIQVGVQSWQGKAEHESLQRYQRWAATPAASAAQPPEVRLPTEDAAPPYQEAIRLLQTVTDHPGSPDDPDQEERVGRLIGMGPGVVPTIAGAIWSVARYGTSAFQTQNAGLLCTTLGRIGGDPAFDALTRFASLEPGAPPNRTIRLGAIRGLGLLGDARAEPSLESARQDPDEQVRDAATCALEELQQRQGAGSPPDAVAAPVVSPDAAEVVPPPTAKPRADTEAFYHEELDSTTAHPAGWEVISQDEPAGSWTMPPETGANRSRSMEATPLTCSIEPFSIENTALKTQLDSGPLVALFHQELAGQLARHGLAVQESHPSLVQPHFSIEGAFVRIDEGNRVARYFLSWMAGQAVVEVEGWLYQNDRPVRELYAKGSQGAGIFGGAAEGLLKKSASFAAKQIANQVAQALINQ